LKQINFSNIQTNINAKIIIISIIFLSYLLSVFTLNVPMDYGGDEKIYIRFLLNFIYDKPIFETSFQFGYRWGMYIVPSFFYNLFSSNPITFFLSSSLTTLISLLIFLITFRKELKYIGIILFLIFWSTNPQIIKITYNLLTQGQGIFALSISLFFLFKILDTKIDKFRNYLLLSISLFYLWGIKEVNIFIILPILIILLLKKNWKQNIQLHCILFVLILIESFSIYLFSGNLYFGRLDYFLFNENNVTNTQIWWDASYFKNNYDGIFSRWTKIYTISKLIFPVVFIIAFYNIFFKPKISIRIYVLSIILLFYSICITLFFKKLNPFVPFVPIKMDNIVIMFPILFVILINFILDLNLKKISYRILISILCFYFLLHHINYLYKVFLDDIKNTNHNILNVYYHFNNLDDLKNKTGCLKFKDDTSKELFIYFSKYKKKIIQNNKANYILENKKNCDGEYIVVNKLSSLH